MNEPQVRRASEEYGPVRQVPAAWQIDAEPVDGFVQRQLTVREERIDHEVALAQAGPVATRATATLFGVTYRRDQAQPLKVYEDTYKRHTRAEFVAWIKASYWVGVWIIGFTLFLSALVIVIAIFQRSMWVADWISP